MMDSICAKDFNQTILFTEMDLQEVFETRKNDARWNTSYPLKPEDWAKYRTSVPLSFADEHVLSFYIHIPFCRHLCAFCEYSRMLCPNEDLQHQYLTVVKEDIDNFIAAHPGITLNGFDIGGGTPTALSDDNFAYLMQIYSDAIRRLHLSKDFEPSIEGTFATVNETKARLIAEAGIKRMSFGIQSTCKNVLTQNHRPGVNIETLKQTMQMLYRAGINKINLDLMYGLKGQSIDTLKYDIQTIAALNPEQVTLYELRTNMTGEENHWDKEALFNGYSYLYQQLIFLGYKARFGQNTFSKDATDQGVSSYLRHRMIDGTAYKGFGLSAQSMSRDGVAYNIGKNSANLKSLINNTTYGEEYTYHLPPLELAAKYIAIAAYHGSFSLTHLSELLGVDATTYYHQQLSFCKANGLLTTAGDVVTCTPQGFKYYGAVFSLFHTYRKYY
jgi:oxygen-independent coproporphyrinogen-3 oxidase